MLGVFGVFLRLGLTSFGGPVAHLGYFRAELVQRRRWLPDAAFADLVALAQFLPGPSSSQVGFGIGLLRAGWAGALAAFVAFTLPSAAIMLGLALGADRLGGPVVAAVTAGLAIAAVAIVAQAVLGMARTLTPDAPRAGIAVVAAGISLTATGWAPAAPLVAIAVGALAGLVLCRRTGPQDTGVARGAAAQDPAARDAGARDPVAAPEPPRFPVSVPVGVWCLALLAALLVALPALAATTRVGGIVLFDAFVRAGALVVGGGHVVLPLLQAAVVDPGWVGPEQFIAGYAAAQALPGPLFSFAAYLGAMASVGPGGVAGAAIAIAGIFLPGFLLLVGVLPFWNLLRTRVWAQALVRGAAAAVVGVLAAALYDPLAVTAITGPSALLLAAVCLVLLTVSRVPPLVVVILGAAGGLGLSLLPS